MQEKHTNLSKEFLSSKVFLKKFEILYAPVLLQSYSSNTQLDQHSIGAFDWRETQFETLEAFPRAKSRI